MKASEITIDVNAKLEVSKSTAEACLKLVEIYINNNSNIEVQVTKNQDGTNSFYFVDLKSQTEQGTRKI